MKKPLYVAALIFCISFASGCSVMGSSGVEIAPYKVLQKEDKFELRQYDQLILATTAMTYSEQRSRPFGKLFDYISGENEVSQKISMTAPVFMEQGKNKSTSMSFVLPQDFSLKSAPKPKDKTVTLEEVKNYQVATITFSGVLDQENIQTHQGMLEDWIKEKQLKVIGPVKAAGYNPPFTIPALRRNEILIAVEKP